MTFNCVHLHIFKMKHDQLIKWRRNWFLFNRCDDNRQFHFQKFQPQIFLASLTPWNPYFLSVNLSMVTSVVKKGFYSIMFCLLHLPCFSTCLDAFGLWDLSLECHILGMVFLNLVFPLRHLRQVLLSDSSLPASAAGEENWRHKKVKITGFRNTFFRNSNEIRKTAVRTMLRACRRRKKRSHSTAQDGELAPPDHIPWQTLRNVTPWPSVSPSHGERSPLYNPRVLVLLLPAAKVNPGVARNMTYCLEDLVTTLPNRVSFPKTCFSRTISQQAKSLPFSVWVHSYSTHRVVWKMLFSLFC